MSNRKQRRAMAKQITQKAMRADAKELMIEKLNSEWAEAMMLCFAIGLHESYGFGKDRCKVVLEACDKLILPWIEGKVTKEDLRKRALDEIGLDIKC